MTPEEVVGLVLAEYDKATKKFGAFNSTHEGYAVIAEELDELWDDVKANRTQRARRPFRSLRWAFASSWT